MANNSGVVEGPAAAGVGQVGWEEVPAQARRGRQPMTPRRRPPAERAAIVGEYRPGRADAPNASIGQDATEIGCDRSEGTVWLPTRVGHGSAPPACKWDAAPALSIASTRSRTFWPTWVEGS